MLSERKCILADRYIPIRKDQSLDLLTTASHFTTGKNSQANNNSYAQLISNPSKKCLSFKEKVPTSTDCTDFHLGKNPFQKLKTIKLDLKLIKTITSTQTISTRNLIDNFYNSILDWSKDQIVGLALGEQVFFRNKEKKVSKLNCDLIYSNYYQGNISTAKFNKEGNLFYLGYQKGNIAIFDVQKQAHTRTIAKQHLSRVGCLENTYDWGFLSGSKDKSIIHHDLRLKDSKIFKVLAHKQEVCGLTINQNKVASSSNDGKIFIWSLTQQTKIVQSNFAHKDAVKSLKWCPWKINLLASGGGKNDHRIILWNSQTQSIQKVIQGNTQITSLDWNDKTKDLISAHSGSRKGGYITVWNYQIQQFTHILVGHRQRIVGMKLNPKDKNEIVSLGADQSLRYWNIRRRQPQKIRKQSTKLRMSQSIVLK